MSADGPLELTGLKRRALLALLLVRANRVVSSDRLVDELWEGTPPESAKATLQTYVSQLRKSLGPEWLHTRPGGYVFEAGPDVLDASRFERTVRDARAYDGRATQVIATLSEALGWWRGPALAEFERMLWAQPEIARLEEIRLGAIEHLADARLGVGEHALLVDGLEAQVREHPLRERLWGQLMVALYRSGRQGDALRAYGRLRNHLREELGIEPSKGLARLEAAVLRQEVELDWPAPEPEPSRPAIDLIRPGEPVGAAVLPATVRAFVADPLVGRLAELQVLERTWNTAVHRERHAVFIAGDAGIGKTRLVAELASRASAQGAIVLYGRSDDERGFPYQPWIESLEGFQRGHGTVENGIAIDESGGIAGLLPQMVALVGGAEVPSSDDADTERSLVFGALVDALVRISAVQPVVLILEDLHWSDPPTLALLRRLLRSSSGTSLLVIGTYRDSELSADDPLAAFLAGLHREVGIERLHLAGLGESETATLLAMALGTALDNEDAALARSLCTETGGNAFFTKEIIQELVAARAAGEQDPWRALPLNRSAGDRLPQSVREVITQRVRRLGPEANDTLAAASVLGHQFELGPLASIRARPEDDVLALLEAARDAGLISEVADEPGRFTFEHSLVEHTLYAELSAARRQRLHRRAAAVLEELQQSHPDPRRVRDLAHHWVASATESDEAIIALEATRRAAEDALATFAPEDAVRWYGHSLDLATRARAEDGLRCELLIGLGTAQRRAGDDGASRDTLLEAAAIAEVLGDTEHLVRAALTNTRAPFTPIAALDSDRIRVLEAALAALGPTPGANRAQVLATLAAELMWSEDLGRRRSLSNEAIAIARAVGEPRTLVNVLNLCFHALYLPDNIAQRTAWADEALEASNAVSDPAVRWIALALRSWAAFDAHDFPELDQHLEELSALGEGLGESHHRVGAAILRASRVATSGTPAEVEAALEALLLVGSSSQIASTVWATLTFSLRWRQGDLAESFELIEQSTLEHPEIPVVRSALALAYVELDRRKEARRLLDDEAAGRFQQAPFDRNWLSSVKRWASISAELGDVPSAAMLYRTLEPFAALAVGPVGGPGEGSVAYQLGCLATTLGRYDIALRHLDDAAAINDRVGAAYWSACTEYERGRCLTAAARSGHEVEALASFQRALAIATANGYALIERRVRNILGALQAGQQEEHNRRRKESGPSRALATESDVGAEGLEPPTSAL